MQRRCTCHTNDRREAEADTEAEAGEEKIISHLMLTWQMDVLETWDEMRN